MSEKQQPISNLDKIRTTNAFKKFSNKVENTKKTKNLCVKTDNALIDKFKVLSFEYYKENKRLGDYSYRHFMVLVLLNIEQKFIADYGMIETPDKDFYKFYTKRGTKALVDKGDNIVIGKLNFLMPLKYSELYFDLMHTYYIKNKGGYRSYSISLFFEYIVEFIQTNKIKNFDFTI